MQADSFIRLHHIATNKTLPEKLRVRLVDDGLIQLQVSPCLLLRVPLTERRLFTVHFSHPGKTDEHRSYAVCASRSLRSAGRGRGGRVS